MSLSIHSRRDFLKAATVGMTLPWVEALAGDAPPPLRLAVVFMGNGVNPATWTVSGDSRALQLGDSLAPLRPFASRINVFKGLWNPKSLDNPGAHYPKMNVLSGLTVRRSTTDFELGTTMDQVIAAHLAGSTPIESMALGTEPQSHKVENGYTALYSSNVSWSSPQRPTPKWTDPQQILGRLTGNGSRRRDALVERLFQRSQTFKHSFSGHDNQVLGEYLEAIAGMQRQINTQPPSITLTPPALPEQPPSNFTEQLDRMFELMTFAFRSNRTRVLTFMMNNDLSGMSFDFLPGVTGGHHSISHHSNNPERLAMYSVVNTYHMEQVAHFLSKLDSVPEAGGTLLDNTLVLFCSSLMDGNLHDSRTLPILIAGGQNHGIRGGRFFDFSGTENRKLCRLHLAIMEKMGVRLDSFGDASSQIIL